MSKRVISLDLSSGNYLEFVNRSLSMALVKNSSYICIANVHMCIEVYKDEVFAQVVNKADLVTPDGMPLVKALKLLYGIYQERVAGMDILPDLLKESERERVGVYFYGGTDEMLQKTKDFCSERYPNLILSGLHSPPFRLLTRTEEEQVIKSINDSGAGFVFVALGCPKQEKWMAAMKGRINACMVGIGGALPVMIGMQKRAPLWMQRASLEWLYRLMQEPKRLFKRYAVTNSMFLVLLANQWLKQFFFRYNNHENK